MALQGTIGQLDPLQLTNENLIKYKYLMNLSSMTGDPITNWPADLLGKIESTNRREINKFFFAKVKESGEQTGLTEQELAAIEQASKKFDDVIFHPMIRDLNNKIQAEEANANSYLSYYRERMLRAVRYRAELETLTEQTKKGDSKVTNELKEVLKMPFWKFHRVYNDSLELVTTNPVIMRENNPAMGVNREVNLGRYIVRWIPGEAWARLLPHENNISMSGYYHPYCSIDGDICFGTAAKDADEALAKCELVKAFTIIQQILTHYDSNSSPYITLANLSRQVGQPQPRPIDTRLDGVASPLSSSDICTGCERHVDNCTCRDCEVCGSTYDENDGPDCDCCYECMETAEHCVCNEDARF